MKNVTNVFAFLWKHRRALGLLVGGVLSIIGYDAESKAILQAGEHL